MTLDQVKYARCHCRKSYPLAHWKQQKYLHDGERRRPDEYVKHNNIACVPCLRKELEKLDRKRNPTDADIEKAAMIVSMLPRPYNG